VVTRKRDIAEDKTEAGEIAPAITVFHADDGYWIGQLHTSPLRPNMIGMSREQARQVRDALNWLLEPVF
jgi:hypothetical protein